MAKQTRRERSTEAPSKIIEVVSGFTFKVNVGNYQSADFFLSQKAECREGDREKKVDEIHAFCRRQVLKSAREFVADVSREIEACLDEFAAARVTNELRTREIEIETRKVRK